MTDDSCQWAIVGCQKKQIPCVSEAETRRMTNVGARRARDDKRWEARAASAEAVEVHGREGRIEPGAPRGLKSARRVKNRRLSGTAKAVPFQNTIKTDFFSCRPGPTARENA